MSIPKDFKGAARRLDAAAYQRAALALNIEVAALKAVVEVEASGSGFDKQGRPKMLFEPHQFWRHLGPGAKRDRAENEGLAYAKWRSGPGVYPKDSYPRMQSAMEIDREAALKSASWGLPQLMGSNHADGGFVSANSMIIGFCESEEHQLTAMLSFIRKNGLDRALRDKNWHAFARGYNGAGYAKHGYHTRLAAAYARHSKARVTPKEMVAISATAVPVTAATVSVAPPAPVPTPNTDSGTALWVGAGVVLLGAVLVGFIVSRLIRGRKDKGTAPEERAEQNAVMEGIKA